MKTLLLLRHAKAERESPFLRDFERKLTDAGEQEAAKMGRELVQRGVVPTQIICSAATRARETLTALLKSAQLEINPGFEESLYGATSGELLRTVRQLPDSIDSAMLVGHNPGMEGLASRLTNSYITMPTAALICIRFTVPIWDDIEDGQGVTQWLVTPDAG